MSASGVALELPPEFLQAVAAQVAEVLGHQPAAEVDPWLSVSEAAEHMRCSRGRMDQLKYNGALRPDGYDGRKPLYRRSTLDRYLELGG